MRVGNRVRFVAGNPHTPKGWPYRIDEDIEATLIEEPYEDIFYARVDGYPSSLLPIHSQGGLVELI